MDSHREEFIAIMRTNKVRMKANQEMLEAIVEHQEVPNEEAAVETVAALKY
jgi:hypothetical protein